MTQASDATRLAARVAEGARALGVQLDAGAAEGLGDLVTRLVRWNRRINVVGPCTADEAVDRHVHDGLALLRLLDQPEVLARASAWTDIGCGAGLPGLVLAMARPHLQLRLVEPVGKKLAFAREAAAALELHNVSLEQGRLEDLDGPAPPGALSRATFAPERWMALGRELVAPDGVVLVCMGRNAPETVLQAAWKIDRCVLPISGATRVNALVLGVSSKDAG